MKNLIAFNLFLFLICFSFNSQAACEAGQMTKLTNVQQVGRTNHSTGKTKMTLLDAGTTVHVTTVQNGEATVYVMKDLLGNYVGGMATLDLKEVSALACQDS